MREPLHDGIDASGGRFLEPSQRDQAIRDAVDGIFRLFELSESQDDRKNSHEILTYALVRADMDAARRL